MGDSLEGPVAIRLKGKYRNKQSNIKSTPYSARTGPHCCNGGCGQQWRKPNRVKWTRGTGMGAR